MKLLIPEKWLGTTVVASLWKAPFARNARQSRHDLQLKRKHTRDERERERERKRKREEIM